MFAVLHIADFPLRAVLRLEALSGGPEQPAALFDGARKKSLLLAANAPARRAGVEPGMTAPQAVARCPRLIIRTARPEAEAEARATLLAIGFTLSPSIEDTAPGVCTAEVKGLDRERQMALTAAAVQQLSPLGLPATAGIATTPLLALYAAKAVRQGMNPLAPSSVLFVADPAPFLAPLPLASAEPPRELAGVLANWGLRTFGDLHALPRDEIIRRFGAAGLELWKRVTGGEPRPLHPVAPPQAFAAELELEEPVETLEPLLFLIRRFLDRLTLELSAAQQVAQALELTLGLENETKHVLALRLPEPTANTEILFRALYTQLESLRTPACIVALRLHLTPTRPLVRQQGLFETGLRDPHGFAETLARVAAIVGSDRIGTPQRDDTHRPDTVRLTPPVPVVPTPAEPPLHAPLGLPLRRFRPPLPAKLEFSGDDHSDVSGVAPPRETFTRGEGTPPTSNQVRSDRHSPTYLWTERFHGAISALRGPWRSSGDWWQQDRAWSRTEWDLALADGGLYRLLLIGDAWFVEGEYD